MKERTLSISCDLTQEQKRRFDEYAQKHNLEGPQLLGLLAQAVSDPKILPSEIKADLRASARFLIGSLTDFVLSFDRCIQDRLRLAQCFNMISELDRAQKK
jgi:hypothetical protein